MTPCVANRGYLRRGAPFIQAELPDMMLNLDMRVMKMA